jgi:amino acid transporter
MSKGSDRNQLTYLIMLTGIAVMALGVAVILALYDVGGAGKVLAIAGTAVGGLIAVGPSLMRLNGKEKE